MLAFLPMGEMSFQELVLTAIGRQDGLWGLSHLDRALSPIHPDIAGQLPGILAALEADRLVRPVKAPKGSPPRFALTPRGAQHLASLDASRR